MDKQTISIKGKLTVDTSSNTVILPSFELNKVYIWGYELCKGSDWNDFLEVVNKLGEENQQLQKQLEEKEKDNQFLKKMYFLERTKNDNYHTEKYGLDKPVEELRKIKLNSKEKEIYYKGFDNCERQFATHIAELQQQLKSRSAEIIDEIKKQMDARKLEYISHLTKTHCYGLRIDRIFEILDDILKEYQK